MTPERYSLVKRIFQAAVECEPDSREDFLEQACAGDAELRIEVESLIRSHNEAETFIEESPARLAASVLASSDPDALAGRRIGPYGVIREIGRGGMGVVYLAARADDEYHKQVAVKLLKYAANSQEVIRRFRSERQILASLDHPNIARLLDAGTTDEGIPYFVMDYIEGVAVDEYCDSKRLPTVERLKLFREICSAIHYAHQNLVVHRDIKPGNILITAEGVPKLLDFGIAKVLDPSPAAQGVDPTVTALQWMTPEYASPEQVRGELITIAADVYSLGVLLYELLTGHRPYRLRNRLPYEIARIICEEEPERPSTAVTRVERVVTSTGHTRITASPDIVGKARGEQADKLRRKLAGDVDNIVLMAMRKDPARRYASVEQFSEDIRRHLVGLPVIARPDTFSYRAGKFVTRHRAGVCAAALIALLLVGGIITTAWQASRAERRFNDVRRLANSFMFELHDSIENLPGSTPARELLVRRALEYLDSLAAEAGGDPALEMELATAYLKVGDVQGRPGFANLGDRAGALESYRKALSIREALQARDPSDARLKLDLATSCDRVGDTLRLAGDTSGALDHYRQAMRVREGLMAAAAASAELRRELGASYDRMGDALRLTGQPVQALEIHRKALSIREELAREDPDSAKACRDLFVSYIKVGDSLAAGGDPASALGSYRLALPLSERLAEDGTNARAQRDLSIAHDKVGNALLAAGDRQGALLSYKKALEIRLALFAEDPKNAEARRDLSISYDKLGAVLDELGDRAGALNNYLKALANDQALAEADPANAQARQDMSAGHEKVGDVLSSNGNLKSALEHYRRALSLRERLVAADPPNVEYRRDLATSCSKLGGLYQGLASRARGGAAKAQWQEARAWYQKGLDILTELRDRGALTPSDAGDLDRLAAEIARCDAAIARL